jgi:hypothetical protein
VKSIRFKLAHHLTTQILDTDLVPGIYLPLTLYPWGQIWDDD